jgi:hypothetical protein
MLEAELAKLLETLRIFQSTYIRDMALSNVLGKALTALTDMREERERLRKALDGIASQMLPMEMHFEHAEHADFEGAYVIMIEQARAALSQAQGREINSALRGDYAYRTGSVTSEKGRTAQ